MLYKRVILCQGVVFSDVSGDSIFKVGVRFADVELFANRAGDLIYSSSSGASYATW